MPLNEQQLLATIRSLTNRIDQLEAQSALHLGIETGLTGFNYQHLKDKPTYANYLMLMG